MVAQRTGGPRANALRGRVLESRVTESSRAQAEAVWELLADLRTHAEWGGKPQGKKAGCSRSRRRSPRPWVQSFSSTGEDSMCRMQDRSVVTEATPPRVLEFVTESAMELKRGGERSDWTVVHRYEIEPEADGCRVTHASRVTRASQLPGALALFRIPVLRSIAMKEGAGQAKQGLRSLVRMAEQRAGM